MDLNALLARLKALSEQFIIEPDRLKDRLIFRYHQTVLKKLIEWIETTPETLMVEKGEQLLMDNWKLINGTCLSYTALPNSPITEIFCELADFVKNSRREGPLLGIVNLLMPTVSIETISNNYPHLGSVQEDTPLWGTDPKTHLPIVIRYTTEWTSDPVVDIHVLLKTHVLGREGRYLIPIELLTVEQAVDLENPYFKAKEPPTEESQANGHEMGSLDKDELCRMHHHSSMTRSIDEAETRIQLLSSDTSHLLGHLIILCKHLQFNSVKGVGSETAAGEGAYLAIIQFNDYYDLLDKTEKNRIPASIKKEIDRLLALSGDPGQNLNATSTSNIDTCIAIRRDALASAMAGEEVILSQIALNDQRKGALMSEAMAHVASLKKELACCLEKKNYTEGHDSLGLTYDLLEEFECTIAVNNLQEVEAFFSDVTPRELSLLLSAYAYSLADECVRAIGDLSNLVMLCIGLDPDKLRVMMKCMSHPLSSSLVRSPRDLNLVLMLLNIEKSQLIFQSELTKTLITTSADYSACVNNLSTEQRSMAFKWMKENDYFFIKNPKDVGEILLSIPLEEQCETIQLFHKKLNFAMDTTSIAGLFQLAADIAAPPYNILKSFLPLLMVTPNDFDKMILGANETDRDRFLGMTYRLLTPYITSGESFYSIMSLLSEEQFRTVFNELKTNFGSFMSTLSDFSQVIRQVKGNDNDLVFDAFKEHFKEQIDTAEAFCNVMSVLTYQQRAMVFEMIKPYESGFINTCLDFALVMSYLTEDQRTVGFKTTLKPLLDKVFTIDELNKAMVYLTTAQRGEVFEIVKLRLNSLIKTGNDFEKLIPCLAPEQRTFVFDTVKKRFHSFHEALIHSMEYLSPEQRTFVFDTYKSDYSKWVKTSHHVLMLQNHLTPTQMTEVYQQLKTQLPEIILSALSLREVMYRVDSEQKTILYEAMKTVLSKLIHDFRDLIESLSFLTPEQASILLKELSDQLPALIKTANNLHFLLAQLNSSQCALVCQSLKGRSELFTTHPSEIVLRFCLDSDKFSMILEAFKSNLITLLSKDPTYFQFICRCISSNPKNRIVQLAEENWSKIITTHNHLKMVIQELSQSQQITLLRAIGKNLSDFIGSFDDYLNLRYLLDPTQHTTFFEATKHHLVTFPLDSVSDRRWFSRVLYDLNEEQAAFFVMSFQPKLLKLGNLNEYALLYRSQYNLINRDLVFQAIKENIPLLITSSENFMDIMAPLGDKNRSELFDSVKESLLELILDGSDFNRIMNCLDPVQKTVFFEMAKDRLVTILDNVDDFKMIIESLEVKKQMAFIELAKDHLPSFVQTPSDYLVLRTYVSSKGVAVFCKKYLERLSSKIKTTIDLYGLLSEITPEERVIVMGSVKKSDFPIKTVDELYSILQMLPLEECQSMLTPRVLKALTQCSYAPLELLKNDNDERIREHYEDLCQLMGTAYLEDLYFKAIGVIKTQSQHQFLESPRRKSSPQEWTLADIINDAKTNKGRSRQACVELGWIQQSGDLADSAPKGVILAYQAPTAPEVNPMDPK